MEKLTKGFLLRAIAWVGVFAGYGAFCFWRCIEGRDIMIDTKLDGLMKCDEA
jgi:hypothetical protein